MSFPEGRYRISSVHPENYRLAFYGHWAVQANVSSHVTVEIVNESGAQKIRFNDHSITPSTSDWFGHENNLDPESRVVQQTPERGLTGQNLLWAITPSGPDVYFIKVWNGDFAWTIPEDPKNPTDILLQPAEGLPNQHWKIVPA
ncbi:unnamed protein product [Rhizoctonia solani]|uniref:Uncharacterized protein n=1 Tax=Rhizoctonia solani TaxID=456999 RepID=A0A8H2XMZ7_9AGAM|nr:unnamed protein product [Rhizoctonia solani]CAE6510308.1 unnamed protein product [Rhizoctonia solani]